MKKFTALLFSLFLITGFSATAASDASEDIINGRYNGKAYIFVEGGVEFSVFPDGQFDFVYVGPQQGDNVQVQVNTNNVNISYNSGYDYEAYVQYDDYGAIIQVEEVPVYYDDFGRIIQAGDVEIRYRNRRIVNVGGLFIHYNNYGYFSHCTGYINFWNRFYVYRPWHVYYARPFYSNCIVYDYPYRAFYRPVRYSYYNHCNYFRNRHRVAYANGRRSFYRPGMRTHYRNGRSVANRNYNARRVNKAASASPRGNGRIAKSSLNNGQNKRERNSLERNRLNSGSRAITQRNDKGFAKRESSLSTRPSNTRGIAQRDKSTMSSRPTKSRGFSQRDNGSVKPKNSGIAKQRPSVNRNNSIAKKRPSISRKGNSQKSSMTSRPQQKRSSVAKRSTQGSRKSSVSRASSKKAMAKRSAVNKSNRSSGSRSKSSSRSTSRRGRGL